MDGLLDVWPRWPVGAGVRAMRGGIEAFCAGLPVNLPEKSILLHVHFHYVDAFLNQVQFETEDFVHLQPDVASNKRRARPAGQDGRSRIKQAVQPAPASPCTSVVLRVLRVKVLKNNERAQFVRGFHRTCSPRLVRAGEAAKKILNTEDHGVPRRGLRQLKRLFDPGMAVLHDYAFAPVVGGDRLAASKQKPRFQISRVFTDVTQGSQGQGLERLAGRAAYGSAFIAHRSVLAAHRDALADHMPALARISPARSADPLLTLRQKVFVSYKHRPHPFMTAAVPCPGFDGLRSNQPGASDD